MFFFSRLLVCLLLSSFSRRRGNSTTSDDLLVRPSGLRELGLGLRQQRVPQRRDGGRLPFTELVGPVGPPEDLDRERVRGEAVVEGGEELDGDVDGGALADAGLGEAAQGGVEVGSFFFFFFFFGFVCLRV